jgi:hypothetical protein
MADNQSILDRAEEAFGDVHDSVLAQTESEWLANIAGLAIEVIVVSVGTVASVTAWTVANLGAPIADAIINALAAIRNTPSAEMNRVIVDTMGEFFGEEFDSSNLSVQPGTQGNIERARAIGADIYGLLEGEFAPSGELSEEQGVLGAEAFAGFATNFAVRSAFVGILGEFASFGKVEAFRALGEDVAQNLGLGRLVRRALTPLVQTTIVDPLTWSLNRKYRPKRLIEADLIKGYHAGQLSAGEVGDALRQWGYRDSDVAVILQSADRILTAPDLYKLIRYTHFDVDLAVEMLAHQGKDDTVAKQLLAVEDIKLAQGWIERHVHLLLQEYRDGFLDKTAFESAMDGLPLGEVEVIAIKSFAAQLTKVGHRTLPLATLERALEFDVIDIGEFRDWLGKEGYSADQVTILLNLTLIAKSKIHPPAAPKPPKTPPTTPPAA